MNYVLAFLIFALCFTGMALGLIFARKVLRKGCSVDPNDPNAKCACETAAEKKAEADEAYRIHPSLKPKKPKD